MKKKIAAAIVLMISIAAAASSAAFAGQWQPNEIGWWWQNDDGSYPTNSWQWLDGNNDGTAECYYFDGSKTYHDVIITYDAGSNSILYNDPASGYTATFTYFGAGLNGWTSFELVSSEEKSSVFFSAPGVMEAYGWDDFESVQRK